MQLYFTLQRIDREAKKLLVLYYNYYPVVQHIVYPKEPFSVAKVSTQFHIGQSLVYGAP